MLFNLSYIAEAKNKNLSDKSVVSLLTCSPGIELYSIFGHCAIRIYDPVNKIDKIYNYGTFDFDSPNFYMEFIKGKLLYFLSVSNFTFFKNSYIRENRSIYEQVINFSLDQRQLLYQYLEKNYLPENRYYLYDFFFDNCATRIRDAFIDSSTESIKIEFSKNKKKISFRSLIKPYIKDHPWIDLGINIAFGLSTDKIAEPYEFMFLPDYLMEAFQNALQREKDKSIPLIKKTSWIFRGSGITISHPWILNPKVIFWFFLILIIPVTYIEFRQRRHFSWIDRIIFGLTGLSGILLCLLWLATDHKVTANNLNLLWAIPFHLPVVFILNRNQNTKLIKTYFLMTGILMSLIIIAWKLIPQQFHAALIPLLLILAIRSLNVYFNKKG